MTDQVAALEPAWPEWFFGRTAVVESGGGGGHGGRFVLAHACGQVLPLAVRRWHAGVSAADRSVLGRVAAPVLDVGCGPGRHVADMVRSGIEAAGIDCSAEAVSSARHRGAEVFHGSVFGPVPRCGEWGSILLLDGNIGIGGDPVALLQRCREVARPGGRVFVETEAPGRAGRRGSFRVMAQASGRVGEPSLKELSGWFDWATVSAEEVGSVAAEAGFDLVDSWCTGGRWFAELGASKMSMR